MMIFRFIPFVLAYRWYNYDTFSFAWTWRLRLWKLGDYDRMIFMQCMVFKKHDL